MRPDRTRPARRLQDDGGAVVIEAAIVLPLMMVFLAGIVDFGVGFRDKTLMQSAVRNGARVGASSVNDPSADQLALSTMYAGLVDLNAAVIWKAIIFEANGITNGQPSTTCKNLTPLSTGNGNASANCNVYDLSQIQKAAQTPPTQFLGSAVTLTATAPPQPTTTCSSGWNRYWCAGGANTTTNERQANLVTGVDSFGLYLEVKYTPFTGVFGVSEMLIADSAVMRMEPAPG